MKICWTITRVIYVEFNFNLPHFCLFLLPSSVNRLVTARKGVALVCADYRGPNVRLVGQNEDDISYEDESDSVQSNIKTEKVKKTLCLI